jgi:hypothetical protein
MRLKKQIINSERKRRPWAIRDAHRFMEAEFDLTIARDSLRKFISRDATLQSHRAFPMDSQQIEVTPQQITEYLAKPFMNISGAHANFVFNMDKLGDQEWATAQEEICIIPGEHQGDLY